MFLLKRTLVLLPFFFLLCTPPFSCYSSSRNIGSVFNDFWNFAEVLTTIQKKAFRSVPVHTLLEESIRHSMSSVDAHSCFFTPEQYQQMHAATQGNFTGIGITFMSKEYEDAGIRIIEVFPEGPAATAGLKTDDIIIEIEGKNLALRTTEEIATLIKGPAHTTCSLTYLRDNKPHYATVIRNHIHDSGVVSHYDETYKVLYVGIKHFSERTYQALKEILISHKATPLSGMILDVRKNAGGLLSAALNTVNLFLPPHTTIVTTRDRKGTIIEKHCTNQEPLFPASSPLFILVDTFTASCAEIVAGALQKYGEMKKKHHFFVVGTSTFGKGSVQEIIPLKSGAALKLTTLLYYFADGSCLQALGIRPDFFVNFTHLPETKESPAAPRRGKETTLKNYITRKEAVIKTESAKFQPCIKTTPLQTLVQKDSQVKGCLQLIRLYDCFCALRTNTNKKATRTEAYNFLSSFFISDTPPL